MNKNHTKKIDTRLKRLGQTLGRQDSDILNAKRTLRHGMTIVVVTGIIGILGFLTKQFDPIGQYYASVSTNDFLSFWGRFF